MTTIAKRLPFKLAILLLGSVSTLLLIMGKELPRISFPPGDTFMAEKGDANVDKAVEKAARLKGAPSTEKVFNEVKRVDATGNWAFGSISIPHASGEGAPWTRLWLAQKTKSGWIAAIDFTPTFSTWINQAPKDIVSDEEKRVLGSSNFQYGGKLVALAGDNSANLSLPWTPGQSWNFNQGPHLRNSANPGNNVRSALDFSGGDQKVKAATEGLFYKTCSGSQVQVRQSNGWQTTYYHLQNTAQIKDGTSIQRGTYLGETGTTTGCGGSATGRHVHFSIQLNGVEQGWNGRQLGGWTIYEDGSQYKGRAEKNGKVVYANPVVGKALLDNPGSTSCNTFAPTPSSKLTITVATIDLSVTASNLPGCSVYVQMWRPAVAGNPEREWNSSKQASGTSITFNDLDGAGNTIAGVSYYTVASLTPIPSGEAKKQRTSCYSTTGGKYLCDKVSR
ncbi:peptidoglycan DD-metalloendopeptidase family protein [Planktothrix sp. FACHB-1355]|uniref:Peptidoglycan DD-metalloendopeptidase family protein n=1 Tax=Aerosakkonema funiforme FACHB-1375 TaxID=2949571 RepID=A0A926VIE0_9CYAN|nr:MULTISPECIES: peptidoglycan DD-metalloendopeptidase family protein [Oscillatoriales]MBD2183693.1 peptidoglycan DD-metalloendopeptidase family protein [Aerosakkonema funiforme FACHB-1375]MBD3559443.1 peptidoglycan DD-metalloendopeptidase family protein [Planktothrix sp. FACHB-1355]